MIKDTVKTEPLVLSSIYLLYILMQEVYNILTYYIIGSNNNNRLMNGLLNYFN